MSSTKISVALVDNSRPDTGVGRYVIELLKNLNIERVQTKGLHFLPHGINSYLFFQKNIPAGFDVYHISNESIARCCENRNSIITEHGYICSKVIKEEKGFFGRMLYDLQSKYMNHAKIIISTSKFVHEKVEELLNLDSEIIHYGINHEEFKLRNKTEARKELGLDIKKKIILLVGIYSPRKNIDTIIKAMKALKILGKDYILLRVRTRLSNSPFEEGEIMLMRQKKIKCLMFENIPQNKMGVFYNSADVLLQPSTYEPFGMPVLEAMASGLPVIASNGSAMPEILDRSGYLVDELTNPASWSDAIINVLEDENLVRKMSKKGLRRSMDFDWKKTAKETWKVYEEVL